MQTQVLLLVVFLLLGAGAQARRGRDRLRDVVWRAHFWTLSPLLVFVAFSTVHLDRELTFTLALLSAVVASWLVLAAGLATLPAVAVCVLAFGVG